MKAVQPAGEKLVKDCLTMAHDYECAFCAILQSHLQKNIIRYSDVDAVY